MVGMDTLQGATLWRRQQDRAVVRLDRPQPHAQVETECPLHNVGVALHRGRAVAEQAVVVEERHRPVEPFGLGRCLHILRLVHAPRHTDPRR